MVIFKSIFFFFQNFQSPNDHSVIFKLLKSLELSKYMILEAGRKSVASRLGTHTAHHHHPMSSDFLGTLYILYSSLLCCSFPAHCTLHSCTEFKKELSSWWWSTWYRSRFYIYTLISCCCCNQDCSTYTSLHCIAFCRGCFSLLFVADLRLELWL